MRRAQNSLELVILMGFLFVVLIGVLLVLQSRIREERMMQRQSLRSQFADRFERELSLASKVHSGYMREFALPPLIGSENYTIELEGNDTIVFRVGSGEEYLRFLSFEVKMISPPGDPEPARVLLPGKLSVIVEKNGTKVLLRKDCVSQDYDLNACAANP